MTTAQPGQEQRMEIEALTDAEAESAFFTLIGMFDKLGCAPGGTVEKKQDEGVTFRLHFNAERVRRLLEATRPTADLGDDGELVEALGDVLDIIAAAQAEFSRTDEHKAYYNKRHEQVQQARDRLILYREARDRFCEIIARAERDGFTPEIEQVLIDLSRSGG